MVDGGWWMGGEWWMVDGKLRSPLFPDSLADRVVNRDRLFTEWEWSGCVTFSPSTIHHSPGILPLAQNQKLVTRHHRFGFYSPIAGSRLDALDDIFIDRTFGRTNRIGDRKRIGTTMTDDTYAFYSQ